MEAKKLIIIGIGETAEIAYEYFTYDSPYQVIGFSVNKAFMEGDSFYGQPVYALEELEGSFPPSEVHLHVAVSYVKLNRTREKLFNYVKSKGYTCANYISSKAFVWRNVSLGENVFIFENNVVQHHVEIGNNVILWSGNHVGHRTVIKDSVYLSSHCVISGMCEIGENSFLGVNCTLNDKIKIAKDNIIGSGALIVKNTEEAKVMVGAPARAANKSSYDAFNVSEKEI